MVTFSENSLLIITLNPKGAAMTKYEEERKKKEEEEKKLYQKETSPYHETK
jgi:hypothetical protein